jgi:hypothetical protein
MARGSRISYKIEQTIEALRAHKNLDEAAKSLGISVSTLKRWKKRPEFQAAFLEYRRESLNGANARIQENAGALAGIGLKLASDPATPASVRVRAVLGFLELANKSLLDEDLANRVAALEQSLKQQK